MPILFLIDLWNFHIFFQYNPKKFQVLTGFSIVAWGVAPLTHAPSIKFWRTSPLPPPPCSCSQHLWATLPQPSPLSPVQNFFWNSSSGDATKTVIWLFGWNSPVYWTIPEKLQTGWVVDVLFWNPPSGIFRFVTLSLEIPEKTSFHPLEILQSCVPRLGNPKVKNQDPRKFHISFSL